MVRYVIRGGQAGFERLQALARMRLPETSNLLDRVGVAPGWTCLDLGSGSGDFTFELARRVGPTGRVTGLDMDATSSRWPGLLPTSRASTTSSSSRRTSTTGLRTMTPTWCTAGSFSSISQIR